MDNEAIRVAVGLRLRARTCESHKCICGAAVDSRGLHSLSCKRSGGRMSRHQHLNDVIWRAVVRAGVPATKEPVGLLRTDGKRPDGLTQIPWNEGKCVTWDVTVTDTLAASNLQISCVPLVQPLKTRLPRKSSSMLSFQIRTLSFPLLLRP